MGSVRPSAVGFASCQRGYGEVALREAINCRMNGISENTDVSIISLTTYL